MMARIKTMDATDILRKRGSLFQLLRKGRRRKRKTTNRNRRRRTMRMKKRSKKTIRGRRTRNGRRRKRTKRSQTIKSPVADVQWVYMLSRHMQRDRHVEN